MRTLALIVILGLCGCNTIEGMGQDLSSGANTVNGWIGN